MKYPACNFPLIDSKVLFKLINNKLEEQEPFSFIRLGDGEGVLLSINKESPDIDFNYLIDHIGLNESLFETVAKINKYMIMAVQAADVLGIRDDIINVKFDDDNFKLAPEIFVEKFKDNFKLRECEKNLGYPASRRISLLHHSLKNMHFEEQTQYCSSWAHYGFHLSGDLFRVLMKQDKIGLISSRSELCHRLEYIFDVEVDYWQIPDMYRDIKLDQLPRNYIEQLKKLLQEQFVEFPGMLFLIGGGFFGKLYCNLVKSQGGVALDVGSLLDAWVGIHSRPAVYDTLRLVGYDGYSVPNKLQLTVENINQLVNSHE